MDTAGWVACADGADPAHDRCRAARDGALEAGQTLVTTDFVADETLTLLRFRLAQSERAAGPRSVRTSNLWFRTSNLIGGLIREALSPTAP